MSLQRFKLVRNVGKFLSYSAATEELNHKKLTLIYGENGLGKTTLTAVVRSLTNGQPIPVLERQRLGAQHAPHIVVGLEPGPDAVFENGAWSRTYPDLLVFDDTLINENVHSGLSVVAAQRQNLHGLILGSDGVDLVNQLDALTEFITGLQTDLRTKEGQIVVALRGTLTVDAFCSLPFIENIDNSLAEAVRTLEAQEQADAVQTTATFETLGLPLPELFVIEDILGRELRDLDAAALASVQSHLDRIGRGSERWVAEGVRLLGDGTDCPFCAQDVAGSTVLGHFRAYFAQAYRDHRDAIAAQRQRIASGFHGDALAAFQRRLTTVEERSRFWSRLLELPSFALSSDEIARVWTTARDALLAALDRKVAAPLDVVALTEEERSALVAFEEVAATVTDRSRALGATNSEIERVKRTTARGNIAAARSDVQRLKATRERHSGQSVVLCIDYLAAKTLKEEHERQKAAVREQLDRYRERVIPIYETAINERLRRFNAEFRIVGVQATDPRGVPSTTYNLQINNVRVPVGATEAAGTPAFKNTLSSGDRNTLALAFFFARLDSESNLANTVVLIDDPITSLDDARSVVTAQEIRALVGSTKQVIVLSHSKPLLCSIWEHADKDQCAALQVRLAPDSTLQLWDVSDAAVTEYDRRHKLVRDYLQGHGHAKDVRHVAQALRPLLEGYLRVACPELCPPGKLLGAFIDTARNATSRPVPDAKLTELEEIKEYANRFHHDTGAQWDREVENINEGQLRHFAQRVLNFVRVQ